MRKILFFIALIQASLYVFAIDGEYAVSKIDSSLLKNAHAVKRFEEIQFTVHNLEKAIFTHVYVITILDEKGDEFADFVEGYDKLQSIESVEGTLYDAKGIKIKSLKKSDLQDKSATGDNNLADDNRLKYHNFYYRVYPYTIRYQVELKYNYTMFYPRWLPVGNEFVSVEYSSMNIKVPDGIEFRHKAMNFSGSPAVTTDKGYKSYKWELKNFAAVEDEYKSPSWLEMVPVVAFAPVQFQIEDYAGNMSNWQDYGKFVYALKANRDNLPDNIKQTVHQLTDGLTDPRQKIAKLYKFLQENTRYISIQLGIGGWQPFDASYVAGKKYGDCKALSNYMYALLKEAGIPSNYTLVKALSGNKFFMPDFPSSQFNHVILSVPLQNDTVWLECTSQTLPAGYLSDHTDDRYVLLIDENGGKLVRTPKYGLNENLEVRKVTVVIDETGNASITADNTYRALQQDRLHGMINGLSKEKVKELLNEQLDIPSYDISSYNYTEDGSSLPVVSEKLQLTAPNYASVTGKRLFIVPNIFTRLHHKPTPDDNRKFDVEERLEYRDIDTVEIKIPEGYKEESLPKALALVTRYGKYNATVTIKDGKIIYHRLMEQYSGRFAASEYAEYVKFFEQVYKADRSKIVLVKN